MSADFPPKIGELAEVDKQSFTNLLENGDFESWSAGTAVDPDGWALSGAGATIARSTDEFIGTYSAGVTRSGAPTYFTQDIADYPRYQNRTVTMGCWVKTTQASAVRIRIADDADAVYSEYHTGGGTWEWLTVSYDVTATAAYLRAYGTIFTTDCTAYFDGAILVEGSVCPAFSPKPLPDVGVGVADFVEDPSTQSFTNLLENGDFESWSAGAAAAPDGWVKTGGSVARSADELISTYSCALTEAAGTGVLRQTITDYARYADRQLSVAVWCKTAVASQAKIIIYDGTNSYTSSWHTGGGGWELLTISGVIDSTPSQVEVYMYTYNSGTAYFDGAILVEGSVCPAFSPKLLADDGRTVAIDSATNKVTLGNLLACTPSSDATITAAGGITPTHTIMRIVSSGGAVNITADPQIAAGSDGQLLIVQGTSDANTVQLDDGTGLILEGAVAFVLGANDMIMFAYDSGESAWIEINRSNN